MLAIFSVLQYVVDNPAMSSNELTMAAIFLPLSSLWASASIRNRSSSPEGCLNHEKKFFFGHGSRSTGPLVDQQVLDKKIPPSPTDTSKTDSMFSSLPSPRRTHEQEVFKDMEHQGLAVDGHHFTRG